MRELRHRRAERAVQQNLLRRVRDVIVAAHHVRDRHLHIVGHDRQVIGGMAVRAQDDEVFDVARRRTRSARARDRRNAIVPSRHPEADRPRRADRARARAISSAVSAQQVRSYCHAPPALLGRLALRLQLVRRAVAVVRVAARDEPRRPSRDADRGARDWKYGRVRSADRRALRPSRARASAGRRGCLSTMSVDERSTSVSSMRRTNMPPWRRANSQLKSAVRAPPTCR